VAEVISPGSIDFSEDSSTYFAMIEGSVGGLVKGELCCFMPLQRHLKREVCGVGNIFFLGRLPHFSDH
jgi:hypothetical protein